MAREFDQLAKPLRNVLGDLSRRGELYKLHADPLQPLDVSRTVCSAAEI